MYMYIRAQHMISSGCKQTWSPDKLQDRLNVPLLAGPPNPNIVETFEGWLPFRMCKLLSVCRCRCLGNVATCAALCKNDVLETLIDRGSAFMEDILKVDIFLTVCFR